jgi:hypothetical protein
MMVGLLVQKVMLRGVLGDVDDDDDAIWVHDKRRRRGRAWRGSKSCPLKDPSYRYSILIDRPGKSYLPGL